MDDYRTAYTWRVLELLCSMWPILETSCSKRASYASNSAHQGGGIGAEKQTHSSHSWSSESVFSHVVGREEALSASFTTCVPPVFSQTFDFYFGETEHAMRAVHPSRLRFGANRYAIISSLY
ncbi:unnamed protein product [Toxocara canis]|uniref:Secreted protein n=1 Tax=Toxocara canis TaxID=6265 RepID=A0A183VGY4_TOXCA|nr:unnamed protein product [Toxocara canis]